MKTNNNQTRLCGVILALLLVTKAAYAFYRPPNGRWLNRDPINEPGCRALSSENVSVGDDVVVQRRTVDMTKSLTDSCHSLSTRRGIARDPAQEKSGASIYAFGQNDVENRIDGTGLTAVTDETIAAKACCKCPYADPCAEARRRGMDFGGTGGVVCCGGEAYPCVWRYPTPLAGPPGVAKASEIIERCILAHEQRHAKDGCIGCSFHRQGNWNWNLPQDECNAWYAELSCFRNGLRQCSGDPDCEAALRPHIADTAKNVIRECAKASN